MKIIIENGKLVDATELKEACKRLPNGPHEIEFVTHKKTKINYKDELTQPDDK